MPTLIDTLLVVPFEDGKSSAFDPGYRQGYGGQFVLPLFDGLTRFEEYLGFDVSLTRAINRPLFGGQPMPPQRHRSLTAVLLSTHLERAGLTWETLDPGIADLATLSTMLQELVARQIEPRTIGLSTTYVMSTMWTRALIAILRRTFPRATVILGGPYYGAEAKDFLSLDADIYCIGAGEVRYPQIVQYVKAGKPLDSIPGLYLPKPDGGLHYTGKAETLDLSTLPPADWSLSARIDPPVDIDRDRIEVGLESQRGCVFKCQFCTFRTLSSPNLMSTDVVVERIFQLDKVRFGSITLTDPTATYPHARWAEILNELIKRGGAPHPIWAYARVSDLPEETVARMAQAGIKQVFVGQESADQRVLNLMRKGTNVRQIQPAIDALARWNINAIFSFIHGYPGETPETIRQTRELILRLNDGHERRPPVLFYNLSPFLASEMAAAVERSVPPSQPSLEECLKTVIAASRIPHAPVFMPILNGKEESTTSGMLVGNHAYPHHVFRFLKAVERGAVIFLEQQLEGRRPDYAELARLKDLIRSHYSELRPEWRGAAKLRGRVKTAFMQQIRSDWSREHQHGPGLTIRAMSAQTAYQVTGSWTKAFEAFQSGEVTLPTTGIGETEITDLAKIIVDEGIERGKARLRVVNAQGIVQPVYLRESAMAAETSEI